MSQHARTVPPRRAARAIGLATVGVLVFTVAAAAAVYRELQGNVEEVDLAGLVGDESARPQVSEPPPGDGQNACTGKLSASEHSSLPQPAQAQAASAVLKQSPRATA